MADKPYVSPSKLKRFFMGLLGEKLNTKEEITANTDVDKFAGAMAVQEIYEELNESLAPIELTVNMSTTYCTDTTTVRAIKSGNVISFNGRITTAKQTSSGDTVRIGTIKNIELYTAQTVAPSTENAIMSVKSNGDIHLNTDALPVGTNVRFNACLICK